jgi:RNA polymerase sigma-70 factor, ECF subfamily
VQKNDPNYDLSLHKELLLRIGRGEKAAFERLYDLFEKPLYSLAYRILGNREEVEEVIQDVFIIVWKRAADYDPRLSRPFSWIIVITRRLCWNKLRSKGRHSRKINALIGEGQADVHPKYEALPSETTEKSEISEQIKDEIGEFPDLQRRCLELALYDGFTHEEIASMVDLPLGTVKTWIRRGVLKLKSKLKVRT